MKVKTAPSRAVEVLRTVTSGGAVKETIPFREFVTGMELGVDNVVSGELVIVVNIVDDARIGTTDQISPCSLVQELSVLPDTVVEAEFCVVAGGAGLDNLPVLFPLAADVVTEFLVGVGLVGAGLADGLDSSVAPVVGLGLGAGAASPRVLLRVATGLEEEPLEDIDL